MDEQMIWIYKEMIWMDRQSDKPRIGIFWYLPKEDEMIEDYDLLLDYEKEEETTVYPILHQTLWEQLKDGRVKIGITDTSIFDQDFNQIPRGRISCHEGRFIVMVGSWYKLYETQLTEWLEVCFNLVDFEYKVVKYFELGNDGGEKELEF